MWGAIRRSGADFSFTPVAFSDGVLANSPSPSRSVDIAHTHTAPRPKQMRIVDYLHSFFYMKRGKILTKILHDVRYYIQCIPRAPFPSSTVYTLVASVQYVRRDTCKTRVHTGVRCATTLSKLKKGKTPALVPSPPCQGGVGGRTDSCASGHVLNQSGGFCFNLIITFQYLLLLYEFYTL